MATATHSWSNQPTPPQGFSTSKTLVAPQTLPVPNQQQTIQSYRTTPTLVAPPSVPQQPLGVWPNQAAPQQNAVVWPNQPAPQQFQGFAAPQPAPQVDAWADLKAPQEWSSSPELAAPSLRPKRKGRGIVAWTLFVFAGGLFAGPQVEDYADQAVEGGVAWLASLAPSVPSFVRPYLPKTVEASASVPAPQRSPGPSSAGSVPLAVAPAVPAEAVQPERRPEIVAQPAPSLKLAAAERPAKAGKRRTVRGPRGKLAATLPVDEVATPALAKSEPRHGASVDPFEGGDGAQAAPREAKPAAESAAVKSQPTRSHDSLDDLMAGGPGAGEKAHDRRSTSKEIDAMLKGVQKSDAEPAPKRVESANANPPLTSADIARAMSGVKRSAAECGRQSGNSGVADLKLTVSKDGSVSNVALRGRLADTPAGECVVRAARNAVFPRNSGLTFDYRIDVR